MPSSPARRPAAASAVPWLVVVGVLVAALSMRGPIVAPTVVLRDIAADFGVDGATVALLTTAPILMFAVLTPLAALVIRRIGAEFALLVSLSGVLAGTVLRVIPGFEFMLGGMLVIGASITVGNVVIPVIVRRDVPPAQVSTVMAAYVAMLNAGSLLTTLATAPLAGLIGWPLALLSWSVITVAGIVLWAVHLRRARRAPRAPQADTGGADADRSGLDARTLTGPVPAVGRGPQGFLRTPVPWLLTLVFGCQAFVYYGVTTWLPALSSDLLGVDRTSAGVVASIFQGVAVAGAFIVPLLTRVGNDMVAAAVISLSWIALTVGVLVAPDLMILWLVIGAIAHSGGFVVVFSAIVVVARSDGEAAGMSALVQGGGYAVAATAGPVLGALHDATGGWTVPLVLLVVVSVLYALLLAAALVAGRR